MENTDIGNNVRQALESFDAIRPLSPSSQWTEGLMSKLKASRSPKVGYTGVIIAACLTLILSGNVYYGVRILTASRDSSDGGHRLDTISSEFLVNPITAKN